MKLKHRGAPMSLRSQHTPYNNNYDYYNMNKTMIQNNCKHIYMHTYMLIMDHWVLLLHHVTQFLSSWFPTDKWFYPISLPSPGVALIPSAGPIMFEPRSPQAPSVKPSVLALVSACWWELPTTKRGFNLTKWFTQVGYIDMCFIAPAN